jgi:hypothetical protein
VEHPIFLAVYRTTVQARRTTTRALSEQESSQKKPWVKACYVASVVGEAVAQVWAVLTLNYDNVQDSGAFDDIYPVAFGTILLVSDAAFDCVIICLGWIVPNATFGELQFVLVAANSVSALGPTLVYVSFWISYTLLEIHVELVW